MAQVPPPTPTSSDLMLSLAGLIEVADDETVDLVFRSSDYGVCRQNCRLHKTFRQFYLLLSNMCLMIAEHHAPHKSHGFVLE